MKKKDALRTERVLSGVGFEERALRRDRRADRNVAVRASQDKIVALRRSPEIDVGLAVLVEIVRRRAVICFFFIISTFQISEI
jgi:hypothetical protein